MTKICSFCKKKPIDDHSQKEMLDCYTIATKNIAVGRDFDEFMHDNHESTFRSSVLHEGSFCETALELVISGILAQNDKKMLALKNLLFDESELSFSFKIDIFDTIIKKYYPKLNDERLLKDLRELRKMRNRVAHHLSSSVRDKKVDRENKRIRLIEIQQLKQKFIFYKYDECEELMKKYNELSKKLSDIVRIVLNKEFPEEYPIPKNNSVSQHKTQKDSEP